MVFLYLRLIWVRCKNGVSIKTYTPQATCQYSWKILWGWETDRKLDKQNPRIWKCWPGSSLPFNIWNKVLWRRAFSSCIVLSPSAKAFSGGPLKAPTQSQLSAEMRGQSRESSQLRNSKSSQWVYNPWNIISLVLCCLVECYCELNFYCCYCFLWSL